MSNNLSALNGLLSHHDSAGKLEFSPMG